MRRILKSATVAAVGEVTARRVFRSLRRPGFWFEKGDRSTCPICGFCGGFLPYGTQRRLHAECPDCGALERHRMLWLYMQRHMPDLFHQAKSVLHIAPEPAVEKQLRKRQNLRYVTGDISGKNVDMRIDICDMPFPTESFDVVICNHVLEHVQEDMKAMGEVHRVLKADGCAILIVPIDFDRDYTFEDRTVTAPADRALYFGQGDHVRIYGTDYFDRLRQALFQVERWKPATLAEYALRPDEEVIVASKGNGAIGYA